MTRGDTGKSYAVLFVDDEEKAQKYFRMAYTNDFPVLTAGSVPEALEVLKRHGSDIGVLITDQRMPGQQGVDLLKRAREDWPEIVRILTTAYSDLDDAIAAVNRGEILRYVTKPWDIQALRAELIHAMDFFLLRRERDLLMAEKFSVRQRMVQSDCLRGLLAIGAGLERLRNAPHAIAAWAGDALPTAFAAASTTAELELWGSEIQETLDLMTVHRSLRALEDSVESGFPDRVPVNVLLRDAGFVVEGKTLEVGARLDLLKYLIGALARLAGKGTPARVEHEALSGGVIVTVTASGSGPIPFTGCLTADAASEGLFGAYLIAWHHGGALKTRLAEDGRRFELTLPANPLAVVLPEPDADWLAAQFSMLEEWD